jgi:putative restriction endonuclease
MRLWPEKAEIYRTLRADVSSGSARVLLGSPADEWPQVWSVVRDDASARGRIYIWNLTYDATRGDYRFQITGVDGNRFVFSDDARTIILGYYAERGLYLASDADVRTGPFGASPAIQTSEEHLDGAARDGFAAFEKRGTGEVAIVIRRDMMATYLLEAARLHELGRTQDGIAEINTMAREADEPSDPVELFPRNRTAVTVMRSVRSGTFARRVVEAYGWRCCACGVQLDLVEAAHIVPAGAILSSDDTRNGLCLCSLHHNAYDDGLLGVHPDYSLSVSVSRIESLRSAGRDGGRRKFAEALCPSIIVPERSADRPEPRLLAEGLSARGWPARER